MKFLNYTIDEQGDFVAVSNEIPAIPGTRISINKQLELFYVTVEYSKERMVPKTGIEPVRGYPRGILSPLRLPIPPLRHKRKESL